MVEASGNRFVLKPNPSLLIEDPKELIDYHEGLSISEYTDLLNGKSDKLDLSKYTKLNKIFVDFLKSQVKIIDSTFTLMIIGMRRSSKTVKAMFIINILMKDKSRVLILYKCPQSLQIELNKIWKDRVILAKSILDCDVQNAIIFCDESLIGMNAKLALTLELREFGEGNAFISHKRIILLLNAQDDGVMRDLRKKAEIVLYNRLGRMFLDDNKDKYIKENYKTLFRLPRENSLIVSNHFDFTEDGVISVNLKRDVPFWTQEISTNMKNISLSSKHQKELDTRDIRNKCVNEIIGKIGKENCVKGVNLVRYITFYYRKKHYDEPNILAQIIPLIKDISIFVYGEAMSSILNVNLKKEEDKVDNCILVKSWSFPKFLSANLEDAKEQVILDYYNQGLSQDKVAEKSKYSKPIVHRIVNKFKENKKMGYWFEKFFSLSFGGDGNVQTNKHNPDFIDKEGKIFEKNYAYSLKYSDKRGREISFHQYEDFMPELKHARKQGHKCYYVVLFDPKWGGDGTFLYVKKIKTLDINDDDDLVVFRRYSFKYDNKAFEKGKLQILTDFK